MESISQALVIAYAAGVVGFWLLGAIEMLGPPLAIRSMFRLGPVVHESAEAVPVDSSWRRPGARLETRTVVGASDGARIRYRHRIWIQPYVAMRAPVKGELELGAIPTARTRASAGILGFIAMWLLGWLTGSIGLAIANPVALLVALPGAALGGGFFAIFWLLSRRFARRVHDELFARIREPADA